MKDYSKPAFPATGPVAERGMSLRDYFAANAPEAPDDFDWKDGEVDSWQRTARWSYVYADAMLAEREA